MISISNIGVSIIIPTFEQDKLFEKALESIKNQTHNKTEIIVVDDNYLVEYSNSILRIINKFPTLNIQYVKNGKNLGSAKSRNRGIQFSKYEYISFLDDDDFYYETKIEDQLSQMLNENALFSICNIELVYPNGYIDYRKRNYLKRNESPLVQHLKYHITGTSTFMFKKSFLEKVNGFPKSDLGDEFLLMTNSLLESDRISHCDKVLVSATVNTLTGLSSNNNKITSENSLIEYKRSFFELLSYYDVRYIKMRHHLVKGFTYFKMKNFSKFIYHTFKAIIIHPFGAINILRGLDR